LATYALDGTSAGTVVQATGGTLVSVTMTKPPIGSKTSDPASFSPITGMPTGGYFCLYDLPAAPLRPRALVSVESDNPVFAYGSAGAVPNGSKTPRPAKPGHALLDSPGAAVTARALRI
jgi:hypothetical protein